MLSDIIKFYSIFFCTLHITCRIMNLKCINPKFQQTIYVFPMILSIFSFILTSIFVDLTYIAPLLLLIFYITSISAQPSNAFTTTIISFGISFASYAISTILGLFLLFPFYRIPSAFPHILLGIIAATINVFLIKKICLLKRFQNGVKILFNLKFLNIMHLIAILLISSPIFLFPNSDTSPKKNFTFFLLILTVIFLIHWWQTQITKSYKQALINRELESLRMELEEKEKQLAEISTRNEELGRLIHKDNKRIPAMEHAVSEFLVMDLSDKEKAIERANTLLLEIQKLSEDRNNTITEIYARKYKHHDTGIPELDTMLNYMEKRAYGEHIKLSVQTAINFHDFVPNNISAEDLSHILSDLLENAIIASKHNASPVIQLQFYQIGKDFVIEIADNGIPFEADSLVNFGLTQLTTHADTGGSGIGLMDIWKTKEKYGISLHITEYENDAPYTKKIALIFNKKNRYTISTKRKEELLALSKRTDLQVF